MKSLISRESHRPDKRYSGVYHIQGSMVTDADLDERSRITQDRTDQLGDDSIKDGVPVVGGAVAIGAGDALSLQPGVIYADGVRGLLTAVDGANLTTPLALFTQQADFPQSPSLPTSADQVIYADIWQRPVYPLEDPYLADAGLHGAETAFRSRTMTQLKAAPVTALADIENGSGDYPQIGTGQLTVTPLNAVILADDCDPCADVVSAEQTIANALWRLEVIDVSGTATAPGTITLAWSIENAAAIASADISHEDFERAGKVYEYFSEITESHLGVFTLAADAKRSAFVDDLSTTPTPPTDHNGQPWPFVRRWDGQAVINLGGSSVSSNIGSGYQLSISGQIVTLRVDAFEVELDLASAAVVAGDYWLVELRRFAPEAERIRAVNEVGGVALPAGVMHHYCTLFRVDTGAAILAPTDAEIRKLSFPLLSDLPATHVGFDNNCGKLYADAENVQEALDNLCDISADDISFESNCPELYGDAADVQQALDALCNIDFSVHGSFRLLFDWGVLCGIVPSLVKTGAGVVEISAGAFLDRSGRITNYKGARVDLNKLELKKEVLFKNARQLNEAFKKDEVCLALAAQDGGEVSVFVLPKSLAYGPDDPGFRETVEACVNEKKIIDLRDRVAKLPRGEKLVAEKVLLTKSDDAAFGGLGKLTEAEAKQALSFNNKLARDYKAVASSEETAILEARIKQAQRENPIGNTQGAARQIRQMQLAAAVFEAFLVSDEERLRRCLCKALFPSCPPELGKAPYFVPIACLRGGFDNGFILQDVCPFCCRKQAMTWRSLQYFIGENRDRVAQLMGRYCCGREDDDDGSVTVPGIKYDPGKYSNIVVADLVDEYQVADTFVGRPAKSATDYKKKILVNDLSADEARKTLIGNGVEIAETFDIDDDKVFENIEKKSVGVSSADRLVSGGEVRPGDKVGLLLQDGVARGYVLLEQGSGKLPFPTSRTVAITPEDELKARELITSTSTAKDELSSLVALRESLATDVVNLKTDVDALGRAREKTITALNEAESQISELSRTRTAITEEIKLVNRELVTAEENRKTIMVAVREGQPVTVVTGNKDTALISRLAGAGITTVADIAKLTNARITELTRTRVLKLAEARKLKKDAGTFLNRPLG